MKFFRSGILLVFLLISTTSVYSQNFAKIRKHILDSIARTNHLDTSSYRTVSEEDVSQLLSILNNGYMMLNKVNTANNSKFKIQQIKKDNETVFQNLEGLKGNLTDTRRILTIRTLQMYDILIDEMLEELELWSNSLSDQEHILQKMQEEMTKVRRNPSLVYLLSNKNLSSQYQEQIQNIRKKYRMADSLNKSKLNLIRFVKNKVSENYITATEAQNNVTQQLSVVMLKIFDKEDTYLWERPQEEHSKKGYSSKTYAAEKNAMSYYFTKQYKSRILMIFSGFLFFLWVFWNYRYLETSNGSKALSELRFIRRIPISSTFIVVFTLFPFFDIHSPAFFVELIQFLLLIVLSILFWERWPKKMFYAWLGIIFFYLLFSVSRSIVTINWFERVVYLLLNVGAATFVGFFRNQMRKRIQVLAFVQPILILSICLNVASVLLNLFGRITLAKILGSSSIFSVTQIVAMSVFMRILLEAFYLQIQKSRTKSSFRKPVNFNEVKPLFNNVLSFLVTILWIIFFAVNLNVFDPLYDIVLGFLSSDRKLGSVTFTYGNLVVFVFVLYASFLLQKIIAYFMGIIDKDNIIAENVGKKGNRLLFARLVIIIGGFLFAVTASSLPVDRITIVFSALGVGIGLGLQNIVSNFVSGIILLFERPFQIGDTIEIGNKSGRVKTISVRSSILQTTAGSEIIIPNGDLLSQQVTNWTLTNRYVQRDLRFFLDGKADFTKIKSLIQNVVKDNKQILHAHPTEVLVEEINSVFMKIVIQFWLNDINDSEDVKSELKERIFKAFHENEIEVKPPV